MTFNTFMTQVNEHQRFAVTTYFMKETLVVDSDAYYSSGSALPVYFAEEKNRAKEEGYTHFYFHVKERNKPRGLFMIFEVNLG